MATADCTTPWLFDPVNGDFFYEVSWVRRVPGERWLYDIEYEDAAGLRRGVFYLLQEWMMAKTMVAPSLGYGSGYQCVVIVDVPKAKDSDRPYYVPPVGAEQAAYDSALALMHGVLWPLGVVLIVLLIPAWFGFERHSDWGWVAAWAVGVIIMSVFAADVCFGSGWQDFQQAQAYWTWFDGLPTQDDLLRPLTTGDFTFLLQGPPNGTTIYAGTWAMITLFMAAAWVGAIARSVVEGCYWLMTPLPLEQLHGRTLADGRAPTVQELDAALYAALAGKRPWQIHVMRRKAEAFIRRFATMPPGL